LRKVHLTFGELLQVGRAIDDYTGAVPEPQSPEHSDNRGKEAQ